VQSRHFRKIGSLENVIQSIWLSSRTQYYGSGSESTFPFAVPDVSGSAGCAQAGAYTKENRGGERYHREQNRRVGYGSGQATGNEGCEGRVYRIHEPQAAADESASEDETGYSSCECYK
jgi:hypothetical protein